MKIKILRQNTPESEPYWESFDYDGPADNSVAGLLDYLNYNDDIFNDAGEKTMRIGWDCSCLQGICGACAMVVNGMPVLACETFLKDLKGNTVIIRPLQKFPVIHDLIVDHHRTGAADPLKAGTVPSDPRCFFSSIIENIVIVIQIVQQTGN